MTTRKDIVEDFRNERPFSLNLNTSDDQSESKLQPGKLYELALFIYTLINNTTKIFDLGKEIIFGDKWDDLVLKQREKNYNKYTFLQIKLIDDSNNSDNFIDSKVISGERKISLKEDDFKLQKYFISYLRIKDQFNSRNDNSKINKLIIFTNAQLNVNELNNNVGDIHLKVTCESDIVPNTNKNYRNNKNISYKITKLRDKFVRKMKENLKSDIVKLAEHLAEYVSNKKPETMSLDKDYLAYYHMSLIDESIIEVTIQCYGKRIIKRGKFTEKFTSGLNLSQRAQNLRNELTDIMNKMGIICSNQGEKWQEKIGNAEWTVSDDFDVRQTQDFIFLPNYDINDEDIIDYFSVLELRAKQLDIKDILSIIQNVEIKKTFLEYYDTDPKLIEFLISDFVHSWKNKTVEREMWILNEERTKFIKDLKIKISKPKVIHKTQKHIRNLEKISNRYNLYYKSSCLYDQNFLEYPFIVIKTESIILTSIKLIQFLNKMKQSHTIFINVNNLLQQKETIKLVDAFFSDKLRLMILSYTVVINDDICEELYSLLSKITKQNTEKTVIFVSSINDDPLIQKFKLIKGYKEYDDKLVGLQYLENASKILDSNIIVQSQCLKLSDFVDESEIDHNFLVNEKVIEEFIKDQEIRIGSKPYGISDLESAYSDIVENVNIDTFVKKLLSENSKEIFLINDVIGSNKKEKMIQALKAIIADGVAIKPNYCDIKKYLEIMKQEDVTKLIKKKITICDFNLNQENFKRICHNNSKRKIYWVSINNNDAAPKFILKRIYDPDFYIAANRFNDEVVFKKSIKTLLVSSNILDTFVIIVKYKTEFEKWLQLVGYEEMEEFKQNCRNNKIKFVSCKAIGEATLKEMIDRNPSQTFHLVKFEQNYLIWCKTYGLIDNLIDFKAEQFKNSKPLLEENALLKNIKNTKIVVFVGDPGIGKSTTLIKLCEIKNPTYQDTKDSMIQSHWVFIVYLKDHLQSIRDIAINTNDDAILRKEIINFLSQIDNSLNNEFSQRLLDIALVKENFKKPVLILFDGFDEIFDELDRKKVKFLLQVIKDRTNAKSWITSRLHFERTLENIASSFSIRLENMCDDQIRYYIKQHLRKRLCLVLRPDEFENLFDNSHELNENAKIRKFTDAFISTVQKVFLKDISKFIGTPLQLHLMLEGSDKYFRKFINNDDHIPDFSYLGNDIWAVYENFIERKYEIYFKKANVKEQLRQKQDKWIFDRYHRNLAKSLMFNSVVKKDLKYFQDILLMVGIIRYFGMGIEFIHPTFTEYFAAKEIIYWIFKWKNGRKNHFTNFRKQEFLLGEVLIKPEYKMVRIFLNVIFLKEKIENIQIEDIYYDKDILHVAVVERHIGIINFIQYNVVNVNINAFSPKPLLHVAVEFGYLEMIIFLLEHKVSIKAKDISSEEVVLHKAARYGRIDIVKHLIKYGSDVNANDKHSNSILHRAVQSKNIEVVEYLIKHGAYINAKNKNGGSVLRWAVEFNNLEIAKLLIEKGAHVNSVTNNGTSILHTAAAYSNLEMIEVLVANSANVHSRDNHNKSVLHTAASYNKLDIVKFLVSKHVDVNAIDNDKITVLHNAAETSNLEMVMFLIANGANFNAKDFNEKSVLHCAARSNSLLMVELLVAIGVDPNAKDKKNISVLHEACESGNLEIVKFLIATNVDVHANNDINKSALHSAANSGNIEMVKFLLKKGISVNENDIFGRSVLHVAAVIKNVEMVKFLVKQGANLNARKCNGMSVLHTAAKFTFLDMIFFLGKKHLETEPQDKSQICYLRDATKIVKFLALRGADVNTKDNQGTSALQTAVDSNNFELVKLLIKLGANITSKDNNNKSILHSATELVNLEMIKLLIEGGLDVNLKDNDGKSALHIAVESRNFELIRYLVKNGADVNALDQNGNSVLHNELLSYDLVQFLVESGADVAAKNINNKSVLHFAVLSCNLEVVKFLLKAGANVNVCDKNGISVLHNATEIRYLAMVKYLVRSGADVNALDNNDKSVLHFASESGDLDIVDFLVRQNASIFGKTKHNTSILHYAVKSQNVELVQYLCMKGLDINSKDMNNKSILHFATETGNLDVVKLLIMKGACINVKDCDGKTVLHTAAKTFDFELLEFLVNTGLDINAEDKDKRTVLHYAVYSLNLNLVDFILKAGADVNAKDKDKKSILHCAVETCNIALVKFIVQKGADVNASDKDCKCPIHIAAKLGCLDIVELLLISNADINIKDVFNKSVLHYAVESENFAMIEFLVAKGMDINIKDINEKSVLQTAFDVCPCNSILTFLIENGAYINDSDKNGITVLQTAAKSGNLEMVELLVANGVDPNAKDKNGKTVVQYAEESGDLDVIKFVVIAGGGDWQSWLRT